MTTKLRIVTTSWDDGDIRDLRLAEMLGAKGMRGTFYCPVEPFNGNPSLSKQNMRDMVAEGFEIGGHGIAHEIMSEVPDDKIYGIVSGCKAYLEDTLSQPVPMFCYPRGRFKAETVRAVQKAGYQGARTVRLLATDGAPERYAMPTSIQVYPHTRVEYLRNIGRAMSLPRLLDYSLALKMDDDWIAIGKKLFDRVLDEGGIWHLWGHSWEVDGLKLWDQMETMLQYVSNRPDVLYINNGDVARYLSEHRN